MMKYFCVMLLVCQIFITFAITDTYYSLKLDLGRILLMRLVIVRLILALVVVGCLPLPVYPAPTAGRAVPIVPKPVEPGTSALLRQFGEWNPAEILAFADSVYRLGENDRPLSLYMTICYYEGAYPGIDDIRLKAFVGAGDALMRKCNYAAALDYYTQGLQLSESLPGKPLAYEFYKDIGNVYSSINDYEQGINYYLAALRECNDSTPPAEELRILFNVTGFQTYINRPDEARAFLDRCREIRHKLDSVGDTQRFLYMFVEGLVLKSEENYPEAVRLLEKSADFATDANLHPRFLCSAWQHLYDTYLKAGDKGRAFHYMKQCEREAEEKGLLRMFPNLLSDLSEYYRSVNDPVRAHDYRYRYLDLHDSITNEREFDAVKSSQLQYESNKVAREIDKLHREHRVKESIIRKQWLIIGAIVIGAVLLGVLLMVIWRQKRKLQESYRSLYELNRNAVAEEENLKERIEKKYSTSNLDQDKMETLAREIERMMEDEVYTSPDFSLDTLATRLESNSKYVSQAINEAFRKNFSSYVNDYRVKLACRRLLDEGYSVYTVAAIGESVGFKSQSSFTSVFRKVTGLSPTVFRKMSKEGKRETDENRAE